MKSQPRLFLSKPSFSHRSVALLALSLSSGLALFAVTGADEPSEATPEKPAPSSETLVFHLKDDVTVRFTAEIIPRRENHDQAINDCGFFNYRGQLYAGIVSTPTGS